MFKWFLDIYASSQGVQRLVLRAVWELLRRTLMLFGDPSYEAMIHGKKICLPISHKLPLYKANYRFYDELPARLSVYFHRKHGSLTMIDVGANVGDTILSCFEAPNDSFLAIEANPKFGRYLKENCAAIQNVVFVEAFCSSEDDAGTIVNIHQANGTARVTKSLEGPRLPQKKIDTLVAEFPRFAACNFLKIDTDGSDFLVIRGAQKLIHDSKPIVLMECDIFDNSSYIPDFYETMKFFLSAGYEYVVAYDNLGYLFQVFEIRDYSEFKYALFHQAISNFGYFDLLILDDTYKDIIDMEISYFVETSPDKIRRVSAETASKL